MSVEYSEVYIGDCAHGDCTRAATVRIHKEWVVCSLHYMHYELSEQANGAGLAVDLLKVWSAQAEHHGLDGLVLSLNRIAGDELARANTAETLMGALWRAYDEADEGETRRRLAKGGRVEEHQTA